MFGETKLFILLCLGFYLPILMHGEVKETHQYIKEWIQTEQLISEEESKWKSEKSTLLDLQNALSEEITELEAKLKQFEKENIGAAQQRINLSKRKENAQITFALIYQKMQKVEDVVMSILPILPTPLLEKSHTLVDKINSKNESNRPLRSRLDATISLLQNIHTFHRSVHLERLEFALDDGKSREFRVIYFGLGVAYFVNESGTVAGWGKPSQGGWTWTRKDELAKEISSGVEMIQNRTLPRFLKLPVPSPNLISK